MTEVLDIESAINKKFGVVSLGCPKNLVDTEVTIGLLEQAGYVMTQQLEDAQILLVNTCSFIDKSKKESVETILEMAQLKKSGSCEKLLVLGCLPQLYKGDLSKEIPEVDAVVGTGEFQRVVDILNDVEHGKRVETVHKPVYVYDHVVPRHLCTLSHTAYVKISEGCDHVCSFCIIPRLRGKQRSRPMESIVEESRHLADKGVKEINLIAQDLTDYGKDIYGEHKLVELLHQLADIKPLKWIRLMYTYPSLVTDELIETIASRKRICKYIDVPLQHISDDLLKTMRRNVTGEQIRSLVKRLRKKVPGIAIRTTFIVGYPGETEEHFEELVDFVEESQFDRMGVFTYSHEEHTLAHRLEAQVPQKIKEKRLKKLMQVQQKIVRQKHAEMIGREIEVVVDSQSQNGTQDFVCRSSRQAPDIDGVIYLKPSKQQVITPGQLVKARIVSSLGYDLAAEVA